MANELNYLRVKNGQGAWVSIPAIGQESKIPAPPSVNGTYMLMVTVSGDAATYEWISVSAATTSRIDDLYV